MVPGFLVVGTKRGGSTSVYHWIAQHPDVAPCRTQKGTHYFDVNHSRGWRWYLSGFARADGGARITGEASPYYMFHPWSARWIADELPDVRLIAVLRDPVARAWSHHQYEFARGNETLPFEAALDAEESRLAGELERMVADPSYVSEAHRYHTYQRRGHYAAQHERLYALFPQEHVLVLQSEALFEDPHGQLERVWSFLDLPSVRLNGLRPMKAGRNEAMPAAAVERLQHYYREHNERLYALPGIDFRWSSPTRTEQRPSSDATQLPPAPAPHD
jgi:hypothetical protein